MTAGKTANNGPVKPVGVAVNRPRGLFDGFEGYQTATEEDYRHVFTEGLVVPDTNVLLNLYRYNPHAREDLITVLGRLGDRLWVPNQVVVEFWRGRESALRDPQQTAENLLEKLNGLLGQAVEALRSWANRISLPSERIDELERVLTDGFTPVVTEVESLKASHNAGIAQDTNKDPVVQELSRVLEDRVGDPLEGDAYKSAIAEAERRIEAKLPPGYKDKQKGDDWAAGDYLVWIQVLQEAERRHCDVLLVTGDVKDDWWRKEHGEARGPRLELVEEMRSRAEVRLYMLRPESLLRYAQRILDVEVKDASVEDIERVERFLAEDESAPRKADCGWTARTMAMLLMRLSTEAPVQEAVIRFAADRNGLVNRDDVYELGEYDRERSLRGFTRPVSRITQELRQLGVIPENAVDVLSPVYDPAVSGYQRASGFRIPMELIPLIRQIQD